MKNKYTMRNIHSIKKLIIAIVALFSFASANAQWDEDTQIRQKELSYGLKLGAGVSTAYHEISQYEFAPSFKIGVFANYKLSKEMYLHPELNFAMRGYNYLVGAYHNKVQLSYIDLPITGRYMMSGFNIVAGPYLSFLVSENYYLDNNLQEIKDGNHHNTFDIGLSAGIDKQFYKNFTAEARINFGFTELKSETGLHNMNILVGLSYTFQ